MVQNFRVMPPDTSQGIFTVYCDLSHSSENVYNFTYLRTCLLCEILHRPFSINLIAKTVAVYKYAYRTVVLFCNTTGS